MTLSKDALWVWAEISTCYDGEVPDGVDVGDGELEPLCNHVFDCIEDENGRSNSVRFEAAIEELKTAGVLKDGKVDGPQLEQSSTRVVGDTIVEVTIRAFRHQNKPCVSDLNTLDSFDTALEMIANDLAFKSEASLLV